MHIHIHTYICVHIYTYINTHTCKQKEIKKKEGRNNTTLSNGFLKTFKVKSTFFSKLETLFSGIIDLLVSTIF